MFRIYFRMMKNHEGNPKNEAKYFNWTDSSWSSFMLRFMQCLEPRFFDDKEIIHCDMEEVNEIIFIEKGNVRQNSLIKHSTQ